MSADDSQLASPNAGQRQPVFLIFEGGGARGVAHVGTYCAIVDTLLPDSSAIWPKLEIKGAAGSSVGALVAALIAVGYAPSEIIKKDGTLALAEALDIKSFDQIFRKQGLKKISAVRDFTKHLSSRMWYPFKFLVFRGILSMLTMVLMYGCIKLTAPPNALDSRHFH